MKFFINLVLAFWVICFTAQPSLAYWGNCFNKVPDCYPNVTRCPSVDCELIHHSHCPHRYPWENPYPFCGEEHPDFCLPSSPHVKGEGFKHLFYVHGGEMIKIFGPGVYSYYQGTSDQKTEKKESMILCRSPWIGNQGSFRNRN